MIDLGKYEIRSEKGFRQYDILAYLHRMPQDTKDTAEWQAEELAWGFNFSHKEDDRKYYNGYRCLIGTSDGGSIESPSPAQVTKEYVEYWNERRLIVKNPVLCLRYVSLVWDFYQEKCQLPKPKDVYVQFVESLIDVIDGGYLEHDVVAATHFEVLIDLVGHNDGYKSRVKDLLERLVNKYEASSTSIGIWGIEDDIIKKHRKFFGNEDIQAAIGRLEVRLETLKQKEGQNIWLQKDLDELLCELYHLVGDNEKVLQRLDEYSSLLENMEGLSGMQLENLWNMQATQYKRYALLEQSNEALLKAITASKDSVKEMQKFEHTVTIPNEQMEEWLRQMTEGEPETQIDRLILKHIPLRTKMEEQLRGLAKNAPLAFLIHTKLLIGDGYPGSVVGPIDTDFEGHLMLQMAQTIQIESMFLSSLINRLVKNGVMSREVLKERVANNQFLDDSRKDVIGIALDLYFQGEYMMFCHLVIPQIENLIRCILDTINVVVIKPSRNIGYQLKTLDELLREPILDEIYFLDKENDHSITTYLRAVLTDQRSLNYRNNLCHGLVNPLSFGRAAADRLIHVLLMLLLVQLSEVEEQN